MSDFTKKFRKLSTIELLKILEEKHKYQDAAVVAAQKELDIRGLKEINRVKLEIEQQKVLVAQKKIRIAKRKELFAKKSANLSKKISPFYQGISDIERTIRLLSFILGIVLLFRIYDISYYIRFMFIDDEYWHILSDIFPDLFPLLILAAGIYLFWHSKNITQWQITINS